MSDSRRKLTEVSPLVEVAKALNQAHPSRARLPAMILLTDEHRVPDPLQAIANLPAGCAVIFRHYNDPARAALAAKVVEVAHQGGRLCLIAGDAQLASEVGADGVHLPERMVREQTNLRHKSWLVTAAAHSPEALKTAHRAGVDACLLSPVFPTMSHQDAEPLGAAAFGAACRNSPLPVYALGGITNETAPQLLGSEAVGIAAIGGFISKL